MHDVLCIKHTLSSVSHYYVWVIQKVCFDAGIAAHDHAWSAFKYLLTAIFEFLPSGEVMACPGPNQLEVVCSSDESSYLSWNLKFPALDLSFMWLISSTNTVGSVNSVEVENVEFEFAINTYPLTSRMSANLISLTLNGGIFMCAELDSLGYVNRTSEMILHVINTTAGLSAWCCFNLLHVHSY